MGDKITSDELGFSAEQLGATSNTALAALEQAAEGSADLVSEWIKRGNAEAVAIAADRGSGAARKAARRGLNVLKARGVTVPERRRVATLAAREARETHEAWLMAPDAAGNVLLVIAARRPASRYLATSVVVNDSLGLQRVEVGEYSQSQLRNAMARVLPGAEYKPVSVPVDWARWRIAAARKRNSETGSVEPLGLASATKLLEPVPVQTPAHPLEDEGLVLSEEDAKERSRTSGRLHGWPEFRGWFPSQAAVQQMMLKVGETLTPGQQPDQADLQQTLDREICAATDRYFSPQRREQLVELMKDSTLSVLQRSGEQAALEVVAAIQAVESAGLITDPPHQVPFLRAFFDKAVAVMVAQGGGQLRIPIARRPEPEQASAEPDLNEPSDASSSEPAPTDSAGSGQAPADTTE
jgi:hypothetical protein